MERQAPFRIIARSLTKPGDLIVEDQEGAKRLFIGSTGTLSRRSLDPVWVEAILSRQSWRQIGDDEWHSLDDLRAHFMGRDSATSGGRTSWLFGAFSRRGGGV